MADEEKQPLTRDQMAAVLAQHIGSGWIVNLGIGIPTLVSNFLYPEQEITLHSENGVIGYGRVAGEGESMNLADRHEVAWLLRAYVDRGTVGARVVHRRRAWHAAATLSSERAFDGSRD